MPVATKPDAERAERPHRERHPRKDAPPQRERHPRGQEAPKPARVAKPEHGPKPEKRERRDGRGQRNDRTDDAAAGSHMPAFLMRPVPQHLIKRKKENEPA